MKISELKSVVKEAVKEAIQEEMKEILLEAVKTPQQVVTAAPTPQPTAMPEKDRMAMRENIQNVLGGMMPDANGNINATSAHVPLQTGGTIDTTSEHGSLPAGEVGMNQIMNLMKGKVK